MFQVIEIDGVFYWDGGYVGNLMMMLFVCECESFDIVLVQINLVEWCEMLCIVCEIVSCLNEIFFNVQLLKELWMMVLLCCVIDFGNGEVWYWKEMCLYCIILDIMVDFGYFLKLNVEWDFLKMFFDEGCCVVEDFGCIYIQDIGVCLIFDIDVLVDEF